MMEERRTKWVKLNSKQAFQLITKTLEDRLMELMIKKQEILILKIYKSMMRAIIIQMLWK